jgi:polysaccharide deacetylase family protein (PEP-CTERM system associated)
VNQPSQPAPRANATHVRHAFTVDVEEWYHGIELSPSEWPRDSRLRTGLDRLLELLDHHGNVKATFFVLGAVAERFPEVVAQLAQEGHEVGCHGQAHQFVYRQTPDEFRADIRRAREVLGSATGTAPAGYRAPYFSIRSDSVWALDILADEGFRYDSSVFAVRNDRYGIPNAPRKPFAVPTACGTLVEIPLTPVRVAGLNIPFSGGAYLRILPWAVQRLAWALAAHEGEPVIMYVHPWELDPEHPRVPLRRRVSATHYARLRLTERRLCRVLDEHEFGRIDDVFALR